MAQTRRCGGPVKHGIGMALGGYPFRPGLGAATIRVNPDGTAHVLVGVTDIGTGAKSTMAIIASEALGIPLNQIQLTNGDTDATPYSVGESGSRTTSLYRTGRDRRGRGRSEADFYFGG